MYLLCNISVTQVLNQRTVLYERPLNREIGEKKDLREQT